MGDTVDEAGFVWMGCGERVIEGMLLLEIQFVNTDAFGQMALGVEVD